MIYLNAYIFISTVTSVMFCVWWLTAREANGALKRKCAVEESHGLTMRCERDNIKNQRDEALNKLHYKERTSRDREKELNITIDELTLEARALRNTVHKRSELAYVKLVLKDNTIRHHRISPEIEQVSYNEETDRHVITEWKHEGRREFTYLKVDVKGTLEKGYRARQSKHSI